MAQAPLKIASPPGYGAIAPLDKARHASLGLKQNLNFAWSAQINAVFVNAVEIPRAGLDYPVAFAREPQTGEFAPVAVLAMRQKENLFVDAQGQWRQHAYIPAYFRRYPFCLADIPSKEGKEAQHLVCVQEDQLAKSDQPLFDARGNPTEAWQPIIKLLEAIEGARQQTRVMMRRLEALNLFTPFDAVAVPKGGGAKMRLQGLHRVDEEKLADIPGKDLRILLKKGELRCIYAHLSSLENFARLLDMSLTQNAR